MKITLRRPTIDGIPSTPDLPAPIVIRRAQIDETEEVSALLGRAYPTENWEPVGTKQDLFYDNTVKAPLVAVSESLILATASLQILPDASECGWVRWVATDLNRRREGLARALVIRLLEIAADEKCRDVRLNTTADLPGAIAMYLGLGFEPLVRTEEEQAIWDGVLVRLCGHT